jgi:hypothetical protein
MLALTLVFIAAGTAPSAAARPGGAEGQVSVDVVGVAVMEEGMTAEQAHEAALLNARRNALIQAGVDVETAALVRNMELVETAVHSRSAGIVRELDVLEAGPVPDAEPHLYRVRARAVVAPEDATPPGGMTGAWRPAVRMAFSSNLPPDAADSLREGLSGALRRCGLVVVEGGDERPALEVDVNVLAVSSGVGSWVRVRWTASPRAGGGSEAGTESAEGHWTLSGQPRPDREWWQRMAVALAQDAMRLWAAERRTSVVFRGARGARRAALAAALRAVPGAEVEVNEEAAEVRASLPVAGDPLEAMDARLAPGGLADGFVPTRATLTHVAYEPAPAEAPQAGPGD